MSEGSEPVRSGSGWVHPVPLTDEEVASRRSELRRWAQAEDERIRSERIAEFGTASEIHIDCVVMPLTGREFRWRSDGFFAELGPTDARGEDDIEWEEWDAQGGLSGIGGWPPPTPGSDGEGGWLCWGPARPDQTVTCRLTDGTTVLVTRLGYLWIAEWRAAPQTLLIEIDDTTETFEWHRPRYGLQ